MNLFSIPFFRVSARALACISICFWWTARSEAFAYPGNPFEGESALRTHLMAVAPGIGTITKAEFENLWRVFPEDLQRQVLTNGKPDRSKIYQVTQARYGMQMDPATSVERPVGFFENSEKRDPSTGRGKWEMNCLLCHAGSIPSATGGRTFYMGSPTVTYDITTFVEDRVALYKRFRRYSSFSGQDLLLIGFYDDVWKNQVFNVSRGTYSVWPAGDYYLALRKDNMGMDLIQLAKALVKKTPDTQGVVAADLDPPAWWNTKYRNRLWIDGFAPKTPKMNALQILPIGNPLTEMEKTFDDVLAYIDQVPAPKNPFFVQVERAERGRAVFEDSCASCHGDYDDRGELVQYPNKTIKMEKIGTDPVRWLGGMTEAFKKRILNSWVGDYGKADIRIQTEGYMPPPLKGVWATAPYLHNGSVPTLYHVLFPQERPLIWKPDYDHYDEAKGGFPFQVISQKQYDLILDGNSRRKYFNASSQDHGKQNIGHTFVEKLSREDRLDVLEYLKTL